MPKVSRQATATLLVAAHAIACGAPQGPVDDPPPPSSAVDGLTSSTEVARAESANDDVTSAVVALRIGGAAPFRLCSAALVAHNVAVTARHCVSQRVADSVVCDDRGASRNGAQAGDDLDGSAIGVYVGASPDFASAPAARVAAIVRPDTDALCNADIALVVLDRPIDVAPLRVRLATDVRRHEAVRSIGYGAVDGAAVGKRLGTPALDVIDVGAKLTPSRTALGSREFELGGAVCHGDSGGPAIDDATGAVVGIVSRGGPCSDRFGHVYTATNGFTPLFARAFALAGGAPDEESGRSLASLTDARPGAPPNASIEASTDNRGCSTSARRAGGLAWGLFAAAALLALTSRRSRSPR